MGKIRINIFFLLFLVKCKSIYGQVDSLPKWQYDLTKCKPDTFYTFYPNHEYAIKVMFDKKNRVKNYFFVGHKVWEEIATRMYNFKKNTFVVECLTNKKRDGLVMVIGKKNKLLEHIAFDSFFRPYVSMVYYYEKNKLVGLDEFKDGNLFNKEIEFFDNGQISMERKYVLGPPYMKIENEINYYRDGKIRRMYRSGPEFNLQQEFYENGQLKKTSTANQDGWIEGAYKEFFENGKLKLIRFFKDAKLKYSEEYYENGVPKEYYEYLEGKKNGAYKKYNKKGELKESGIYENGVKKKGGNHSQTALFNSTVSITAEQVNIN